MVLVRSYSRISGRDVRGEVTVDGRQPRATRRDAALVRRVGVGVEQADGDRLDVLVAQQRDGASRRGPVQRRHRRAVGVEPLVDLEAQRRGDQRRRLVL